MGPRKIWTRKGSGYLQSFSKVLSRRWKEIMYRKPMRTRGRIQGANKMRKGRNDDRTLEK